MKIEIGRKYRTIGGNDVEILRAGLTLDNGYSAIGLIEIGTNKYRSAVWTTTGKSLNTGEKSVSDLIEVSPYDDFKIDDPVVVWSSDGCKYKRHFAGINDFGRPLTYDTGQTSWTSKHEITTAWDHCMKAEDYKEPR